MSYRNLCQSYRSDNLSYQKFMIKNIKTKPSIVSNSIPQPISHLNPQLQKKNNNVCNIDKCMDWSKDPLQWGPHLWMYMHFAAANYPDNPTEQDIKEMIEWLCSLPVTIPCDSCRKHFRRYIEKSKHQLPYICKDKQKLFNFLVDIHNKVNERNQKPILNYDEARKIYQN